MCIESGFRTRSSTLTPLAMGRGPKAAHLKVFQRTPNLTVPMRLRKLSAEEQEEAKRWYPELFDLRERCFGGILASHNDEDQHKLTRSRICI